MPRFEPGSAAANEFLEANGYVVTATLKSTCADLGVQVIKQVLDQTEAAQALELTWEYLEGLGTGSIIHLPTTKRAGSTHSFVVAVIAPGSPTVQPCVVLMNMTAL